MEQFLMFKAVDGKIFDSYEDCRKHEKALAQEADFSGIVLVDENGTLIDPIEVRDHGFRIAADVVGVYVKDEEALKSFLLLDTLSDDCFNFVPEIGEEYRLIMDIDNNCIWKNYTEEHNAVVDEYNKLFKNAYHTPVIPCPPWM